MRELYDYHTHSNNSIDGNNSVMEVCQSAVDKGLSEIVITDHFEPEYSSGECSQYNPGAYFKEIEYAKERYNGKIKVKAGVELGQPHYFPLSSENLINRFPYDYVIGSAHKFDDGTDLFDIDYTNIASDEIIEAYLVELKKLAVWGKFDCIGHLDLVKRYASSTYKNRISLLARRNLLKEVFKIIIPMGKGIEINTSGLRQSPKETMPGIDVLKLYRSMGGEILTTGSDAHYAQDIGKGLDRAMELALEAGFGFITVFDGRKPSWKRISLKPDIYSIPVKANIA